MKCPSCAVNLPQTSSECPSCGINFERWKKREAQKAEELRLEKVAAMAALKEGLPEVEKATDFDPLLGRKIAAVFVLAWIAGGGMFLSCHQPKPRRRARLPPESTVNNSTTAVTTPRAEP